MESDKPEEEEKGEEEEDKDDLNFEGFSYQPNDDSLNLEIKK